MGKLRGSFGEAWGSFGEASGSFRDALGISREASGRLWECAAYCRIVSSVIPLFFKVAFFRTAFISPATCEPATPEDKMATHQWRYLLFNAPTTHHSFCTGTRGGTGTWDMAHFALALRTGTGNATGTGRWLANKGGQRSPILYIYKLPINRSCGLML